MIKNFTSNLPNPKFLKRNHISMNKKKLSKLLNPKIIISPPLILQRITSIQLSKMQLETTIKV